MARVAEATANVTINVDAKALDSALKKAKELESALKSLSNNKIKFDLPSGSDLSKLKTQMKSLQNTIKDSVSKGTKDGISEGTKDAEKEKAKEDKKKTTDKDQDKDKKTADEDKKKSAEEEGKVEATATRDAKQDEEAYRKRLNHTKENVEKAWQAELDEIQANLATTREYNKKKNPDSPKNLGLAKQAYVAGETNKNLLASMRERFGEFADNLPGFSDFKFNYGGKEYTWKELLPHLQRAVNQSEKVAGKAKTILEKNPVTQSEIPLQEAEIERRTKAWTDTLDASAKEVTETLASKPKETKAEKETTDKPKKETKESKEESKPQESKKSEESKTAKGKESKTQETKTQEAKPQTQQPQASPVKESDTAKLASDLDKAADSITKSVQERAAKQIQYLADSFDKNTKNLGSEGITPLDKYFNSSEANTAKNLLENYAKAFGSSMDETFKYKGKDYNLNDLSAEISKQADKSKLEENISKSRSDAMADSFYQEHADENKARNEALRDSLTQLKADTKEAQNLRNQADKVREVSKKVDEQAQGKSSEELASALKEQAIAQVEAATEKISENAAAFRKKGKNKLSEEDAYWTAVDSQNQAKALSDNLDTLSRVPGIDRETFKFGKKEYNSLEDLNAAVQKDVGKLSKYTTSEVLGRISGMADEAEAAEKKLDLDSLEGEERTAREAEIEALGNKTKEKSESFMAKSDEASENLSKLTSDYDSLRDGVNDFFKRASEEATPEEIEKTQNNLQKQLSKFQKGNRKLKTTGRLSPEEYFEAAAKQQAQYELMVEEAGKVRSELPWADTNNYQYGSKTGNFKNLLDEADRDLVNIRRNAHDVYSKSLAGTGTPEWQKMVTAQKEQIVDPYESLVNELYEKPAQDFETTIDEAKQALEDSRKKHNFEEEEPEPAKEPEEPKETEKPKETNKQKEPETREPETREPEPEPARESQPEPVRQPEPEPTPVPQPEPTPQPEPQTQTPQVDLEASQSFLESGAQSLSQAGTALSGAADALSSSASALSSAAESLASGHAGGENEGQGGGPGAEGTSHAESADIDVEPAAEIETPRSTEIESTLPIDHGTSQNRTGDVVLSGDEAENLRDSLVEADQAVENHTETVEADTVATEADTHAAHENTETTEVETQTSKEAERQKANEISANYGVKEDVAGPASLKDLVADAYKDTWNDFVNQREELKARNASPQELYTLAAEAQEKIQAINKAVATTKRLDPSAFEGVEITTSTGLTKTVGGSGSIGDYLNRQLKKYTNQQLKLTDEERAEARKGVNTDISGTSADAFVQASEDRVENIRAEKAEQKALEKEQARAAKAAERERIKQEKAREKERLAAEQAAKQEEERLAREAAEREAAQKAQEETKRQQQEAQRQQETTQPEETKSAATETRNKDKATVAIEDLADYVNKTTPTSGSRTGDVSLDKQFGQTFSQNAAQTSTAISDLGEQAKETSEQTKQAATEVENTADTFVEGADTVAEQSKQVETQTQEIKESQPAKNKTDAVSEALETPPSPPEDVKAKVKEDTFAASINDAAELLGLQAEKVSTDFGNNASMMLQNAEKAVGKEQSVLINGATELVDHMDEKANAMIAQSGGKTTKRPIDRGTLSAEFVQSTGIFSDDELLDRYLKQYETLAKQKAGLEKLYNTEGGLFEGGANQDLLDEILEGRLTSLEDVNQRLEATRDSLNWIGENTDLEVPDLGEIDKAASEVSAKGKQVENIKDTVSQVGDIYDNLTDDNQFRQIQDTQVQAEGFAKKRQDALDGAKTFADGVEEVIDAGLLTDDSKSLGKVAKQVEKSRSNLAKEMKAESKLFENNEYDPAEIKKWAQGAGEIYGMNVKGTPNIQGNTAEITFEKDGKVGKLTIDDLAGNFYSSAKSGAYTGKESILGGMMSPEAARKTGLVTEKEANKAVTENTAQMDVLTGAMENLAEAGRSAEDIDAFTKSKGVREELGTHTGDLETAREQRAALNEFAKQSGVAEAAQEMAGNIRDSVSKKFDQAMSKTQLRQDVETINGYVSELLDPNQQRQYNGTYTRATNYKGTGGNDVDVRKGTQYNNREEYIKDLQKQAKDALKTIESVPEAALDNKELKKASKPITDTLNELESYLGEQKKAMKGQTLLQDTANKSLEQAARTRMEQIRAEDLKQNATWRKAARDYEITPISDNEARLSYSKGDRRITETISRPETDTTGNFAYSTASSQRIGTTTQDWFAGFGNKMKTLTQYLGSMAILGYGMEQMSSGVSFVKQMDKDLTNIGMTMGATDKELQNLGSTAIETGKALSTDSTNVLSAMTVYANAGENAQSIAQKSKAAIMLSNVTGADATTTADMLQGATAQFGVTDEQALNTLEKISSELPLDFAKGITSMSDAITNAGAVAKESGLSMEEFSAITGEVAAVTRQEGSQIGNTLKTTMARISRSKSADEEVTGKDRSNAAQAYKDVLGYDLFDANGEYKDLSETLNTLAGRWDTLTDVEKNFIAEQSAGTRGLNVFRTMMDNWGEIQRLASGALSDMTYADTNQEKWNQSLEGKTQRLKATYQGMFNDILSSDTLGFISDLGSTAVSAFGKVTKATDDTVSALTGFLPGGAGSFLGDAAGLATLGGGLFSLFRTGAEFKKSDYSHLGRALATGFAPITTPIEDFVDWFKRRGKASELAAKAGDEYDAAIAEGKDMSGVKRSDYVNAYKADAYEGTQFGWFGKLLSQSNDLSLKGLAKSFTTGLKSSLKLDAFKGLFGRGEAVEDASATFAELTEGMGGFNKILANIGRWAPAVTAAGLAFAAWDDINTSRQRSQEATDEGFSDYKTRKSNIQSAQSFLDQNGAQFEELSKGVNTATNRNIALTNDEYQRYLDLSNQIAQQFPSMVKGYDEQGNAILAAGYAMEDFNDILDRQRVSLALDNLKNGETYGDAFRYNYDNTWHGDDGWWQKFVSDQHKSLQEAAEKEARSGAATAVDLFPTAYQQEAEHLDTNLKGTLAGDAKGLKNFADNLDLINTIGQSTSNAPKSTGIRDLDNFLEGIDSFFGAGGERIDRWQLESALRDQGLDVSEMWDELNLDSLFEDDLSNDEYQTRLNDIGQNALQLAQQKEAELDAAMDPIRSLMDSELDLLRYGKGYDNSNLSGADWENLHALTQATSFDSFKDMLEGNSLSEEQMAEKYAQKWTKALNAAGKSSELSDAVNDLFTLTDNSTISEMRKAVGEDLVTIKKAMPDLDMPQFMKDLKLDDVHEAVSSFDDLVDTLSESEGLMNTMDKPGANWEGWTPTDDQSDRLKAFSDRVEAWADSRHINTAEEIASVRSAIEGMRPEAFEDMSWSGFEEYMDVATFNPESLSDKLSVLAQGVSDFRTQQAELQTLMQQSNTMTGLDSASMNSLIDQYSALEGFDASKLFDFSGSGIKANARYLGELNDQLGDLTEKQYSDQLKDLESQLVSFDKQIAKTSNADKKSTLVEQRDMIQSGIDQVRANLSEIQGLNSNAQQFITSMSTGGRRAGYEQIGSAFSNVEQLYQQGYVGSEEFRKAVQLMVNRDMSKATVAELVQTYNDNIAPYKALTDTSTPYKALATGQEILKNSGLFEEGEKILRKNVEQVDANGNKFTGDLEQTLGTIRGTREEIAKALDLDPSLVDSWLQMAQDMGITWENTGEETSDALADVRSKAEEAIKSSDEFKDIDLGADSLSEVNDQLEKLESKNVPESLRDQYNAISDYLNARAGELTTKEVADQYKNAHLETSEISKASEFSAKAAEAVQNLRDLDISNLTQKYGAFADAVDLSFDNIKNWDVKDFADLLHNMDFSQAKEFLSDLGISVDDSELHSLLATLDEVKRKIDGINESDVKPSAEEARGKLEEAGFKEDVDKHYEGKSDAEVKADLQQKYNEANRNARNQGLAPGERNLDSNVGNQIQQENKVAQQQQEAAQQQQEAAQQQEKSAQTNQQTVKQEQKQVQGPGLQNETKQPNKEAAQQHVKEREEQKQNTANKLVEDNVPGFSKKTEPKATTKPSSQLNDSMNQPVGISQKEKEAIHNQADALKGFREAQDEVQKGTAKVKEAAKDVNKSSEARNPLSWMGINNYKEGEVKENPRKVPETFEESKQKKTSTKSKETQEEVKPSTEPLAKSSKKIGKMMGDSFNESVEKESEEYENREGKGWTPKKAAKDQGYTVGNFFDDLLTQLGLKPTTAKASDYNGEMAPGYEKPEHSHELGKKTKADQAKGFREAEKGEVEVEGKVTDVDTSEAEKDTELELGASVKELDQASLQNIGEDNEIDVAAKVDTIDKASLQNIGREGQIDVDAEVGDIDTAKLQNIGREGQIEVEAKVGDIDEASLQNVGDDSEITVLAKIGEIDKSSIENAADAEMTVNAKVGEVDTSNINNAANAHMNIQASVDSVDTSVINNASGGEITINARVGSVDDSAIQALEGSTVTVNAEISEGSIDTFLNAEENSTVNVTVQVAQADMSAVEGMNPTMDVTAKVTDVDTSALTSLGSESIEVHAKLNYEAGDVPEPTGLDKTGHVTWEPGSVPEPEGLHPEGAVTWSSGDVPQPRGLHPQGNVTWSAGTVPKPAGLTQEGTVSRWNVPSVPRPDGLTQAGTVTWNNVGSVPPPDGLQQTGTVTLWVNAASVPEPPGLHQVGTVTWSNDGSIPTPAPLSDEGTVTWRNEPVPPPAPLTATGTVHWVNDYSPPSIAPVTATVHWVNDTSGVSAPTKVNGTAYKSGTAYQSGSALAKGSEDKPKKSLFSSLLSHLKDKGEAQARGNWGLKKGGVNLVGELGRELVVRGSKWFTVGDNGAEMRKLQKGDIVFNHKQTEEIFKKGRILSGDGRGHQIGGAQAQGTALMNGYPRDRHKDYTNAADYYDFRAFYGIYQNGEPNRYRDPYTVGLDWDEFLANIYQASAALNVLRGSTLDMSQAFLDNMTIMDHIAQASTRLQQQISNMDILFNNTFASVPARLGYGVQKQQALYNQQQLHKEARDKYWQAARAIGLDENTMNLLKEGSIDIQVISNADPTLAKKMQQFQEWYNKGREEETAMMQSQLDIQQNILDMAEMRLEPYEQRTQAFASQAQQYSNKIDIVHAKGHFAGRDFYQGQYDSLKMEQAALEDQITVAARNLDQMQAAGMAQDSTEYKNQVLALMELNEQWQELTKSIYDCEAAQREEQKAMYEWGQAQIDQLHSENEFVRKLFGTFEEDMFAKSSGRFNINGGVMIATHAMDYNMYMGQAEDAKKRAADLYAQMAKDNFNPNMINKDVIDEYNEARQAQMDYISAAIDEKKAIQDLYENQYDHMLQVLDKVIDKKKEQLEAEKDLYDYQKKIQNQVDDINELEKIYLSLENDDSEEGKARRQEVKNDLDEANEELEEMEYEQWLQDQEQIMDDYYNAAEETFNARLQEVEELLAEANALLSNDWHAIDKLGWDTEGEKNWLENSKEEWNHLVKDNIDDVTGNMGFQLSDQLDDLYTTVTEPSVRNLSDQFDNLSSTTKAVDQALNTFVSKALAYATQLNPNTMHPEATNAYENEVATLTSPVKDHYNTYGWPGQQQTTPQTTQPAVDMSGYGVGINYGAKVTAAPGAMVFDAPNGFNPHPFNAGNTKFTVLGTVGEYSFVMNWDNPAAILMGWYLNKDLKLAQYASGGFTGDKEGLAYLHPQEMILNQRQFTNFARLTELIPIVVDQFKKNSILGTISDNLLEGVKTESNDNHATSNNSFEFNITMNDVQNPQQFVNELRTNRDVIRAINDITEAKLTKNSKLGQRKGMSAL